MSPTILAMLYAERRGNAYIGSDENGLTDTIVYPGCNNWFRPVKSLRERIEFDRYYRVAA